jgi:protein toll
VGTTSTPVPLIAYDAFVTYAKEDEQFVQDEICRRLEAEDYSLCMLYRDLPSCSTPGYHIVQDDLITKMERSSCLILVLTQNFLNHEWQTVQIRTVHQWAKDQQKKLIVVLCGELQLNDLDMELGRFLRISTKIRWSDYQFWKELFMSMPSKVSEDCYAGSSSAHYSDMYGTITPSHIV